ncbi:heme transporter FLVCR2 [Anabrus simplex]|uniref:heme transporter FLVCR2 n=1 Tax=Anabrus simplex TaxID=316456 RepID=UPI0034DD00EB
MEKNAPECRVYRRRWLILALFVLSSMSNALQWIQYSIITHIITHYYQVSADAVNWTSMVFMVVYIPLIFPGSWLLDRMGLRVTTTLGALGTCVGAWIKVLSVAPDRFWVGFLGQTIVAISQVCILSVPARLAAVWFGPHQVSSACSIGVFGNQFGIAIGFLFPPLIVKDHQDVDLITPELSLMFYLVAGFTTLLLVLIVIFYRAAPPVPPSPAQAAQIAAGGGDFFGSMKRLVMNPGYVLLLIAYGINVGVFYAISTLLSQVILSHFPNHDEDAGTIGLVIVVGGMVGSVVCGIVLDRTQRFKETTLAVYFLSLVTMAIYSFTLDCGYISVVYVTATLLGFFMTGYLPVGFELAAELTHPEPEGTSSGLLNMAAQVFGILFTLFYSWLFELKGDLWANLAMCGTLVLGTALTAAIKANLRRQAAQNKEQQLENKA